MAVMNGFINKLLVSLTFSEASELTVTASDLSKPSFGEAMISVSFEGEAVTRIPTATGTCGSLQIYKAAVLSMRILKTSPAYENYINREKSNAYIGGDVVLKDEVGVTHKYSDASISIPGLGNLNGTEADIEVQVKCNYLVNTDSITG